MAKKRATGPARSRSAKKSLPLKTQVQHDIDKALATAGIPSAIDKDGWRWMQDPSGRGLIGVVAVTGKARTSRCVLSRRSCRCRKTRRSCSSC